MSPSDTMIGLVAEWVAGDAKKETEILALLDAPEYKALPYIERNRPFVTSSKLKALAACAYHAKLQYIDEIDPGFQEADYFVVGQGLDDRLTNGYAFFREKYVTVAKRTEKAAEENPGKILLSPSQSDVIQRAAQQFESRSFFPKELKKRNVIWIMEGLPCKAELDNFDADREVIGDLKTTANITTFHPMDYQFQMAFYAYGIELKWDKKVTAELYVVDKHTDWTRSHLFQFTRPTLMQSYYRVQQLAKEWKWCLDNDTWPHCDVDSAEGRETCWNSPYWNFCPFCPQMKPTIV